MFNYRQDNTAKLNFIAVGAEGDVAEDEPLFVDIGEQPIAIVLHQGELYAFLDACSHDGEVLADGDIEDENIICPRHGARFSLTSGKALTPPAVKDIPVYPVRVRNGQIEIGIPRVPG